jgi:hypothetical protein
MDNPHHFMVLGTKILWVLSLGTLEVLIPDLLYVEMMSVGPTIELSSLSGFWISEF